MTRPLAGGAALLDLAAATPEGEELLLRLDVLYPNKQIVRLAVRAAAYSLPPQVT